jgi:hypothetical protein
MARRGGSWVWIRSRGNILIPQGRRTSSLSSREKNILTPQEEECGAVYPEEAEHRGR